MKVLILKRNILNGQNWEMSDEVWKFACSEKASDCSQITISGEDFDIIPMLDVMYISHQGKGTRFFIENVTIETLESDIITDVQGTEVPEFIKKFILNVFGKIDKFRNKDYHFIEI